MRKARKAKYGQLADLIAPDRDYFNCAPEEIAGITSESTIVGGKIVYATGDFSSLTKPRRPRRPIGHWCAVLAAVAPGVVRNPHVEPEHMRLFAACAVHGHNHGAAWSTNLPVSDLKTFWGLLGCACWAV
jgi:hypothetical protein